MNIKKKQCQEIIRGGVGKNNNKKGNQMENQSCMCEAYSFSAISFSLGALSCPSLVQPKASGLAQAEKEASNCYHYHRIRLIHFEIVCSLLYQIPIAPRNLYTNTNLNA